MPALRRKMAQSIRNPADHAGVSSSGRWKSPFRSRFFGEIVSRIASDRSETASGPGVFAGQVRPPHAYKTRSAAPGASRFAAAKPPGIKPADHVGKARTVSPTGATFLTAPGERSKKAPSLRRARSSAGEHSLHTGGVTGSIPVAPTICPCDSPKSKTSRLLRLARGRSTCGRSGRYDNATFEACGDYASRRPTESETMIGSHPIREG